MPTQKKTKDLIDAALENQNWDDENILIPIKQRLNLYNQKLVEMGKLIIEAELLLGLAIDHSITPCTENPCNPEAPCLHCSITKFLGKVKKADGDEHPGQDPDSLRCCYCEMWFKSKFIDPMGLCPLCRKKSDKDKNEGIEEKSK